MGYQLKSEYTLELIKNPQAYNYIDNQFFLTGFILATGFDESALQVILDSWKAIDLITSDRIRFLFYIDNEKDLMGFPHRPYFSEPTYKKYNSKLLQVANQYNFEVSIKKGTQLADPDMHQWYPQEKVLKLARSLGLSAEVPCLVWTTFDRSDIVFYKSLQGHSPEEILSEIKDFCNTFYDENVTILNTIDRLESSIEDKCGSLYLSVTGFKLIRSKLEAVAGYREIMVELKGINWQKSWNESMQQLERYITKLVLLDSNNDYINQNLFQRLSKWTTKCLFIDRVLNSNIQFAKLSASHISNALIDSLNIYLQLPDEAIQITSRKLPEGSTDIFKDFVTFFEGQSYAELPYSETKGLKGRIERLLDYCKTKSNSSPVPLTLEDEYIIGLSTILVAIEGLSKFTGLTEEQRHYQQRIISVIKSFYYENTTANGMTIQFWLYYKYNQQLRDVEKYVQDIVEVTKSRVVNTQEVATLLEQVNTLSTKLKFDNFKKYKSKELPDNHVLINQHLNTDQPVTKVKSGSGDEQLQNTIRESLVPIQHVMTGFERNIIDDAELKTIQGIKEGIGVLNIIHAAQYVENMNPTFRTEVTGNEPTVNISHLTADMQYSAHTDRSLADRQLTDQPACDNHSQPDDQNKVHPDIATHTLITGNEPVVHISQQTNINHHNTTHQYPMEKKNNPWISGSFYLVVIVVILSILMVLAKMLPFYVFPIVLIGGLILFTAVSIFQIYNDGLLPEKSFLSVLAMVFRQIPILASVSKQAAKRKPNTADSPKQENGG